MTTPRLSALALCCALAAPTAAWAVEGGEQEQHGGWAFDGSSDGLISSMGHEVLQVLVALVALGMFLWAYPLARHVFLLNYLLNVYVSYHVRFVLHPLFPG